MTKTIAFILIIALRLAYQPSAAQPGLESFSDQPVPETGMLAPINLLSFKGIINNDKVVLEWIVSDNESADQFEIERSIDGGVHFKTAAFVFGTDLPETARYTFSEKPGSRLLMYRVKLIDKNKQYTYSPVIRIRPQA